MAPNSIRATLIRAEMVASATDRNLSVPMQIARVTHDDNTPVGTLIWVRTNEHCNNDASVIIRCPGGWVAQYRPGDRQEDGTNCVFAGIPAARGGYNTGFWGFARGTDSETAQEAEGGESLGFEGRAERAGLVRVKEINGPPAGTARHRPYEGDGRNPAATGNRPVAVKTSRNWSSKLQWRVIAKALVRKEIMMTHLVSGRTVHLILGLPMESPALQQAKAVLEKEGIRPLKETDWDKSERWEVPLVFLGGDEPRVRFVGEEAARLLPWEQVVPDCWGFPGKKGV